ncbi:MAG: hypothetical protein ABI759_06940 [Candidatus Solibacter sp.]
MKHWCETGFAVDVQAAEYQRLLGYPPGFVMEGRAQELAQQAIDWYAANGRPWLYARELEGVAVQDGAIVLEGEAFRSQALADRFTGTGAGGAVLAAMSAGSEIEEEAQRLWHAERPDEYYFLEVLGSAIVERLAYLAGSRLCQWAEPESLAVLPHDSPGYPSWDIGEQVRLLQLLNRTANLPGPLEALESGALKPKKSLMAVYGLAPATAGVRRLTEMQPCDNCRLPGCQYRRPKYTVNPKALRKWAGERLTLHTDDEGRVLATFRYEGTTCTNMGRSLAFEYRVRLSPREAGYTIEEQECAPSAGDTGHRSMCRYLEQGDSLLTAIAQEKWELGRTLADAVQKQRAGVAAGCYCEPAAREHKWGLVLQTLHYALHEAVETGISR